MALYFDATSIVSADARGSGGSLKSRVFSSNVKSSPAQVYALIAEVSKWDVVLKEVVDNAGLLAQEPKLTPLLSLFLVHDLLLSKNGIAAPSAHKLRLAVERHKTRLRAEFARCRLRRGCVSVEQLQSQLLESNSSANGGDSVASSFAPRWVRINNARTTLEDELRLTFSSYNRVASLAELGAAVGAHGQTYSYYVDEHVPDLLALHPGVEVTAFDAYKSGRLILQDKASCFPGYLLLGDPTQSWRGDIIDACAAPGNKTTHLLSLLGSNRRNDAGSRVLSFDASEVRSRTLERMVTLAGVRERSVLFPGQDFLAVTPDDPRFRTVTALLLDPSCSGSGIRGREDIPKLALPVDPRAAPKTVPGQATTGRKRKRNNIQSDRAGVDTHSELADTATEEETRSPVIDVERLAKLSNLQTQIVEHAFAFPAATRVTYSTCSIHEQENENVVSRALSSSVAKRRGWRILRRTEQVTGMKTWCHRGVKSSDRDWHLTEEESEGCIRSWPDGEEGTSGFFVAGFVRDDGAENANNGDVPEADTGDDDEESWHGFSD